MAVVNLLRSGCLFVTVLAMLLFAIWHLKPELVHQLDAELNARFDAEIKQQAKEIVRLYQAGDYAATMELALQELRRIDDVRKLHVVYGTKRDILLKLFQSSAKLGAAKMEVSLPFIADWAASDERDVDALKAYIHLLQNIPGREPELQEAMTRLQRQFPGMPASPAPGMDAA
jgi:hypothetical protein